MGLLWFLVIGLFIGFLSAVFSKNADLGKLGNIFIGIAGALTTEYFLYSLGMSARLNMFWNLVFAIIGSLFSLYIMRKLIKAF